MNQTCKGGINCSDPTKHSANLYEVQCRQIILKKKKTFSKEAKCCQNNKTIVKTLFSTPAIKGNSTVPWQKDTANLMPSSSDVLHQSPLPMNILWEPKFLCYTYMFHLPASRKRW